MSLSVTEDRRTERRRKVLKGGHIAFNGGYSAYECVVKDISSSGARLAFGDEAAAPHEFALSIKGEVRARPARVVWRYRGQMGVAFAA